MEAERCKKQSRIENRFREVSGGLRTGGLEAFVGTILGAIFDQKSKKSPKVAQRGAKSPEKTHLKIDAKIGTEKEVKSMPKAIQLM